MTNPNSTTVGIRKDMMPKFKWIRNATASGSDIKAMEAIIEYLDAHPEIIEDLRRINLAKQPR